MLIRASEIPRADLGSIAHELAHNLLGQTKFDTFCELQDINLDKSFLYFVKGRCVGLALLAQRAQRHHLAVIAVHPRYRSRGIGGILLAAISDEASLLGLTLDVLTRNERAISFFQAKEFKPVSFHCFWYRTLPLLWRSDVSRPREISADIALELTGPGRAWAVENATLSKKRSLLRGVVSISDGKVSGSAVYSVVRSSIVVYRLIAQETEIYKSLLRHMHLCAPAASTIYLRWMAEEMSEHFLSIGLRRHSQYVTLAKSQAGGLQS